MIRLMKQENIYLESLCDGLDITLQDIQERNRWLDWETAAELLERIEKTVGGRLSFLELIRRLAFNENTPAVFGIARVGLSPRSLYQLVVRYITPQVFPIHRSKFIPIDKQTVRIELTLPSDARGSEQFFWAGHATYEVIPRIFGLADARVESTITAYKGSFTVYMPESLTLLSRTRRLVNAIFGSRQTIDELAKQQKALQESFNELKSANLALQAREKDLYEQIILRDQAQSALRKQGEQLLQAQKLEAVGRLASGIAHDFNNILTVLTTYTELLAIEINSSKGKSHLEQQRRALERASALTTQLLSFARPQHLRSEAIDVNAVIREQLLMLQRIIGNVNLVDALEPSVGLVVMDPIQLQQVMLNLILNASDAINGDGHITVNTKRCDANRLAITVTDSGTGISKQDIDLIFEPFFTTKGERGTGLGLAMVQKIVHEVGGSVSVQSQPGNTVFCIELPTSSAEHNSVQSKTTLESVSGHGKTVLLLEDDDSLRMALATSLSNAGFLVKEAADGSSAISHAVSGLVDAVVADIMVGKESGPVVASRIKKVQPNAEVLFISGYADAEIERLPSDAEFLRKPFPPSELTNIVFRILEQRK